MTNIYRSKDLEQLTNENPISKVFGGSKEHFSKDFFYSTGLIRSERTIIKLVHNSINQNEWVGVETNISQEKFESYQPTIKIKNTEQTLTSIADRVNMSYDELYQNVVISSESETSMPVEQYQDIKSEIIKKTGWNTDKIQSQFSGYQRFKEKFDGFFGPKEDHITKAIGDSYFTLVQSGGTVYAVPQQGLVDMMKRKSKHHQEIKNRPKVVVEEEKLSLFQQIISSVKKYL